MQGRSFSKDFFFIILIPSIALLFVLQFALQRVEDITVEDEVVFDLKEIRKRGALIAITDKNTINYFVYKGRIQGFQYELLKKLSTYLDIPLKIIIENDLDKSALLLQSKQCDIIANDITITKDRKSYIDFTAPLFQSRQVLVQRKKTGSTSTYINSILELGHKKVYVISHSSHYKRLKNLSEEIGEEIVIVDRASFNTPHLIKEVALGNIDYTVSDEHIAKAYANFFDNIDYSIPISLEQNISWGIRRNSPVLKKRINNWLQALQKTRYYNFVKYKYFESAYLADIHGKSNCSLFNNRISLYDDIVKEYSEIIGWDWRLLSSLIYQESRFNPGTSSRVGAFGLMQLMPVTAQKYEIDSLSSPSEQILAGVKYLKWLDTQLQKKVICFEERKKFVVAAYNVGLGHIFDAQGLADKHGRNSQIWDNNVDYYLLNKSEPQYYNDTLVRHGMIKGRETVAMVKQIWERYHHYLNLID